MDLAEKKFCSIFRRAGVPLSATPKRAVIWYIRFGTGNGRLQAISSDKRTLTSGNDQTDTPSTRGSHSAIVFTMKHLDVSSYYRRIEARYMCTPLVGTPGLVEDDRPCLPLPHRSSTLPIPDIHQRWLGVDSTLPIKSLLLLRRELARLSLQSMHTYMRQDLFSPFFRFPWETIKSSPSNTRYLSDLIQNSKHISPSSIFTVHIYCSVFQHLSCQISKPSLSTQAGSSRLLVSTLISRWVKDRR
jgi:hypothetical protein